MISQVRTKRFYHFDQMLRYLAPFVFKTTKINKNGTGTENLYGQCGCLDKADKKGVYKLFRCA